MNNQLTSKAEHGSNSQGSKTTTARGNLPVVCKSGDYEQHECNLLLPPMLPEQFNRLSEDIRQNGLKVPIVLCEGKILDGWNRYEICRQLRIEPRFEHYKDHQPLRECWSLNIARRHLETSQLAVLANELMERMGPDKVEGDKNVPATKVDETGDTAGTRKKGTKGKTRSLVSRLVGVSEGYIQQARALKKKAPDLYEQVRLAKLNLSKARAEVYRRDEAAAKDTSAVVIDPSEKRFFLHNCDILKAPIEDGSIDAIITDPPYGGEHLDCWRKLGEFGARKLKTGGVLLAMGGLYHLPEQIQNLKAGGLEYYWMLCCRYEDGHGDYPRPRKVRTFWKPVFWFVKGEYDRTFQETDVFPDPYANASRGKRHHRWGQSLPFFTTLINKFTYADELVCDPFLGGGTTGIACLDLKRRFVGIDIDVKAYGTSHRRLTEWKPEPITVELLSQTHQEALAS